MRIEIEKKSAQWKFQKSVSDKPGFTPTSFITCSTEIRNGHLSEQKLKQKNVNGNTKQRIYRLNDWVYRLNDIYIVYCVSYKLFKK